MKTPSSPMLNVSAAFAAAERRRALQTRDRHLPDHWGACLVALTFLLLLFSGSVPVLPALIFLMVWLGVLLMKGFKLIGTLSETLWLLSVPALAMLSTVWSDYRLKTLYLSTALIGTFVCVLIMNRAMRFDRFIKGLTFGIVIALLITLSSGKYGIDYMSGTYSLIGYLGSKNAVGLTASVGILTSITLFFSDRKMKRRFIICTASFILCVVCLYLSRSATSLVSAVVAGGLMFGMALVSRLPRHVRPLMLGAGVVVACGAVAVGFLLGAADLAPKLLGKDSTLTGRTYLWREGYKIGWERPLLGHGFSAFWVQGEPRAERFWYEFQIYDRTGFHFHDMYIQAFVDLGFIGVSLITLHLLLNCFKASRLILHDRVTHESILLIGLSFMFLIRSFVEVDILSTFSVTVLIFYSINLRINEINRAVRANLTARADSQERVDADRLAAT